MNILQKLIEKKDLTTKDANMFLAQVMEGKVTSTQAGAVLTALGMKGETPDEILGFIQAMKKRMVRVHLKDAIDVCGSGGDGAGTFNISTAVSFVVAGASVRVTKHGNRAASSRCGSADVLEALGVNINLTPKQAEEVFKKVGMVFLFAPLFHPSMKQVGSMRKELGIRTIFNFLGPFVSPASVTRQLIGVPSINIAKKLAEVAQKLNYKHLFLVSAKDGLDEISMSSETIVFEIKNNVLKKSIVNPKKYGFKKSSQKEILGGSVNQNAKFIKYILNGKKDAKRDIVVLNSAFAFYLAGKVKKIEDGIRLAERAIDNGNAKLVLEKLIEETQKYG